MITDLQQIISQHHLIVEPKEPSVVTVKDAAEGFDLAKDLLYQMSDKKTVLFLSGGKTPQQFYLDLTKEEKLDVGAVGLVDERYGPKMHEGSNEAMIHQTGLLGYLKYRHIPFYPILQNNRHSGEEQNSDSGIDSGQARMTIKNTASQYDETLRFLLGGFSKSIGILGIGLDGHTAGLPVGFTESNDQALVTYFTDFPGPQKERISMTFLGLSMLDIMVVLVFGSEKLKALQVLFDQSGSVDIPAQFFKKPEIATKTLIITDQHI